DFCLMCGNDYVKNVPQYGPVRCKILLDKYGGLDNIPDELDTKEIIKVKKPLPLFDKKMLRNVDTGEDYRGIRREFTDGRQTVDRNKLELEECDIQMVSKMLEKNIRIERFSKAHEDVINAEEYRLPFDLKETYKVLMFFR